MDILSEQFCIAVNEVATEGKIPPGDPLWATYNDKFVNRQLDIMTFANEIYTGHGYTTWHRGRRSIENFELGQHLALDFDNSPDIQDLLKHDFIQTYGGIVHTTPSHTTDNPRCRVIFFLDQPIKKAEGYSQAAKLLVAMFPGADPSCTDASRFFFGHMGGYIEPLFNILPLTHLRTFYGRFRDVLDNTTHPAPTAQPRPSSQTTGDSNVQSQAQARDIGTELLDRALRKAPVDGRNNVGFWLACQLRDNLFDQAQAMQVMESYQMTMERAGEHAYTLKEALHNMRSAYSGTARDAWH